MTTSPTLPADDGLDWAKRTHEQIIQPLLDKAFNAGLEEAAVLANEKADERRMILDTAEWRSKSERTFLAGQRDVLDDLATAIRALKRSTK